MSLTYNHSFGSYNYGDNVAIGQDTLSFHAPSEDTYGTDGTYTELTRIQARRLSLSGWIMGSSPQDLRDQKDLFKAAHATSAIKKLTIWGDRYLWAQVDGSIVDRLSNKRYWEWECELFASDPFYYSTSLSTDVLSTSMTTNVVITGSAYATPYFTFNVTSIGTNGIIEIINVTTGQIWKFKPPVIGSYTVYMGHNPLSDYTLNRAYRWRVFKDGTDYSRYQSGQSLILLPGTNILSIIGLNSATVNSCTCYHIERFV